LAVQLHCTSIVLNYYDLGLNPQTITNPSPTIYQPA
jgi:hypothetical protein